MSCEHVLEQLSDFIEGGIDPALRAEIGSPSEDVSALLRLARRPAQGAGDRR